MTKKFVTPAKYTLSQSVYTIQMHHLALINWLKWLIQYIWYSYYECVSSILNINMQEIALNNFELNEIQVNY